jgi:hypothetical protein
MKNTICFAVVILTVIFGQTAFGQVNTATVTGIVTDPAGAIVPGTQVQLQNDQTGSRFTTTANDAGQYTFNFIPVGTYTLTAHSTGFQDQVRRAIGLAAGASVNLDIRLELSSSKQEIEVRAESPLVDTLSSDQHETMTTREVRELPTAKLDWTNLLKVDPGVNKAGNNGVTLNGLPPAGFSLTVDGTNSSPDAELPSLGFYQGFNVINTINSDAIEEISTTKGIAPASVAGSMSGNINIITKGGTNQFHGSLFEFNDLNSYNARNQFLTTNPHAVFNEFGGSIGGPILHDKLFFFTNLEVVRSRSFSAISDNVPTPEFVAQTLAAAPIYRKVFSVYALPNQPYAPGAQTGQYIVAGSLAQDDSNGVGRIDWTISSKNLFTARYSRSRPEKNQPRSIAVNPRITTGHGDVYNGQFTHSGVSWTAVTRYGLNRLYLDRADEGYGAGLDQVKFNFDTAGAEVFQKKGLSQSVEETIAINHGRHSIQFGGIFNRQRAGRIDDNTNGFTYANLSDFLANIPNQIQINFPVPYYALQTKWGGGFIQDDFRVRPNLTINMGLRYDYWTVPKESNGRVFNRQPTALGPGFGDFRPPDQMYDSHWPNFGPRLGFSLGLGSDRKTVIRGGSGIFFNPHPIFGGPIEVSAPTAPTVPNRLTLSRAQALALGLSFPVNTSAVLAQLIASGTPIANTAINPYFPNPYSIQWTLGVQRELPHNMVLDVAYVGNHGLHLNMVRMENLPDRITGVAPSASFGQFRYYDTSDASKYNSLQVQLLKRYSSGLSFTVAYAYSNNMAFGDADLLLNNNPQDNNNLRADYGPTPFDIRHNFNASVVYEIPFAKLLGRQDRLSRMFLEGWQLSGIFTGTSGLPANVTNSKSSYPNSRPDVVAGVDPVFENYHQSLQYFNPAAFLAVPLASASGASIRPGNLGHNALRAPGTENLDASLAKNFALTERTRFQLRGDFFNAFNHTNLGGLVNDVSKTTFGRLTSATSRSVQIGARVTF